jgi:type I restriction enzyme S subunit
MQPNQNPEQIARDAIALVQQEPGFDPGDSAREQAQQEIVRSLDRAVEEVERNDREIDAALKRREALRQSILHRAFTDRLVPQSPSEEPVAALLDRECAQNKARHDRGHKSPPQ